jgi:hypothetical protein
MDFSMFSMTNQNYLRRMKLSNRPANQSEELFSLTNQHYLLRMNMCKRPPIRIMSRFH